MKERPILFSGAMVRAIMEGRKTQTRRIVKPQPPAGCRYEINGNRNKACCLFNCPDLPGGVGFCPPKPQSKDHLLPCPYGKPGDRLWVRETFAFVDWYDGHAPSEVPRFDVDDPYGDGSKRQRVWYQADEQQWNRSYRGKWRPSIHMPRWASRITLEITGIRCERLQSISHSDAIAEGIESTKFAKEQLPLRKQSLPLSVLAYSHLWDAINGDGFWDANPWVWVVEFKRLEGGK